MSREALRLALVDLDRALVQADRSDGMRTILNAVAAAPPRRHRARGER